MLLTSTTKTFILFFFLILSNFVMCQNDIIKNNASELNNKQEVFEDKNYKISFGIAYNSLIATGDKYFGLAYDGKGGFNANLKLFVYDRIFIGGLMGVSYFENNNTALTGNYSKTSATVNLFIG